MGVHHLKASQRSGWLGERSQIKGLKVEGPWTSPPGRTSLTERMERLTAGEVGSLTSKAGTTSLFSPRTQGVFRIILLLDLTAPVGGFRGNTLIDHFLVFVLRVLVCVAVLVLTIGHGTRSPWVSLDPVFFRHDAPALFIYDPKPRIMQEGPMNLGSSVRPRGWPVEE
jgi:hypothetical protein